MKIDWKSILVKIERHAMCVSVYKLQTEVEVFEGF